MLLRAAKERDLTANVTAATTEADAAEKGLKKISKNSPEWSTRNQDFIVAKGKQQMAELELASFKANRTFEDLEATKNRFKETTAQLMQELDDARKKK